MGTEPVAYCREIEAYLCQKNDGHLIRVVGPSFELVSRWAAQGVPLTIAFRGVDRYFERYYRNGPRRRPVRIDFCEADVLDVFDEWRRSVGLTNVRPRTGPSLPSHLERVVMRLTAARATGRLGTQFDTLIDQVAREFESARANRRAVRGAARQVLLERLAALDAELLRAARDCVSAEERAMILREADEELSAFRDRMAPDAYVRARDAAIDRLVRERFALPTIAF